MFKDLLKTLYCIPFFMAGLHFYSVLQLESARHTKLKKKNPGRWTRLDFMAGQFIGSKLKQQSHPCQIIQSSSVINELLWWSIVP